MAAFTVNGGSYTTSSAGEIIFSVTNITSAPVTVYVWRMISGVAGVIQAGNTFQMNGSSTVGEAFIFVRQ